VKKELCVKLFIYKDYTEICGQQNIKFISVSSAPPKIKTELQNSSCMTDQKMTFTVEVEGMPVPEVKWYVFNKIW